MPTVLLPCTSNKLFCPFQTFLSLLMSMYLPTTPSSLHRANDQLRNRSRRSYLLEIRLAIFAVDRIVQVEVPRSLQAKVLDQAVVTCR
jgi:hypothetical protein